MTFEMNFFVFIEKNFSLRHECPQSLRSECTKFMRDGSYGAAGANLFENQLSRKSFDCRRYSISYRKLI